MAAFRIIFMLYLMFISKSYAEITFTLSSSDTSITVTYSGDPPNNYDSYELKVDDDVVHTWLKSDVQTAGSYVIDELEQETMYHITIEVPRGNNNDVILLDQNTATRPYAIPADGFSIVTVTSTSIGLSWDPDDRSTPDSYTLTYTNQDQDILGDPEEVSTPDTTDTIDNLLPGHTYKFTLVAVRYGEQSGEVDIQDNTKPASPSELQADPIDSFNIQLTWTNDSNNLQDYVRVTYDDGNDQKSIDCYTNPCDLDFANALPGYTTTFTVIAFRGVRSSSAATVTGTTRPLSSLEITDVRRTTDSLQLEWSTTTQHIVDNFRVESNPQTGGQPSSSNSGWSFQAQYLMAGVQYTFQIYPSSNGVETDEPVVVTEYTKPFPPTNAMESDVTTGTLAFTWSPPQSGSVETYLIEVRDESTQEIAQTKSVSGEENGAGISDLIPGKYYRIDTYSVVGGGIQSSRESFYAVTMPLPPSNLRVEDRGVNYIMLTWDPPADQSILTKYVIKRSIDPTTEVEVQDGQQLTATFNNLEAGTSYTFEAASVSEQNSLSETSVYISESFYTNPAEPDSLTTTSRTSTSLTVTWEAPPTGNHDGYEVLINGEDPEILGDDIITKQFTELTPATEHTIELKSTLEGLKSTMLTLDTVTRPNIPENLRVTDFTTAQIDIEWDPPSDPVQGRSYSYSITVSQAGSPVIDESPISTASYSASNLRAGAIYEISVKTLYDGVESMSAAEIVQTLVPKPPTNVRSTYQGQTSIEMEWDPPQNSEFSGFHIILTSSNGQSLYDEQVSQQEQIEIPGLSAGSTYTVSLSTLSGDQESDTIALDVDTVPTEIATISFEEVSTNTISVSWSASEDPDFTAYSLEISPADGNDVHQISRGATLQHTFTGLIPGDTYTVLIKVLTGTTASSPVSRTTTTDPLPVLNLRTHTIDTDTLKVSWDVDPDSVQTMFQVSYEADDIGSEREDVNAGTAQTYTKKLRDLVPGATYRISVVAISNDALSEEASIEQTTDPLPPASITILTRTSTSLDISWSGGMSSIQDVFQYRITALSNSPVSTTDYTNTTLLTASFDNLYPGGQYRFEVRAASSDRVGDAASTLATLYPLPPISVSVDRSLTTTSSVTITWTADPGSYVWQWAIRYAIQGTDDWSNYIYVDNDAASSQDVALQSLVSGANYTVQIYGVTETDLFSLTSTNVLATVRPSIQTRLTENVALTTSVAVAADYTEFTGIFDVYVFTLSPPDSDPKTKRKDDETRTVIFNDLTGGTNYEVSVHTKSGAEISSEQSVSITTNPNIPQVDANQSPREITIYLRTDGGADEYHIECASTRGCSPRNQWIDRAPEDPTEEVYDNLVPNTLYTFEIYSRKDGKTSTVRTITATTAESTPGKVETIVASPLNPDNITFNWSPPLAPNGEILGYELRFNPSPTGENVVDLGPEARSYFYRSLTAGETYTFEIRARTSVGLGEVKNWIDQTPIWSPYVAMSGEAAQPVKRESQASKVTVTFTMPFSERYGAVLSYAVIVSTSPDSPPDTTDLPTWAATRGELTQTYQAIERCDSFTSLTTCSGTRRKRQANTVQPGDTVDFVAGAEDCDPTQIEDYCNGELDPDTTYYFTLRGFTDDEGTLFSDGPTSGPIATGSNNQTIIIIIGVLAAILVVVIVLTLFVIIRRRKQNKDTNPGKLIMAPKAIKESHPILVGDFIQHCAKMSTDSDRGYMEEYDDLKSVGEDVPHEAANLPENRSRNRFINILPHDHSRVKLLAIEDQPGSDYTNANYVAGANSKREFIVCQGPLETTMEDFWRMIWEQHSTVIVMLTRVVESGRTKCHRYWPEDEETVYCGDLQITMLNEKAYPNRIVTDASEKNTVKWNVTEIELAKGIKTRKITHFHFLDWPDFKVADPADLVAFVNLARARIPKYGHPTVVHCSAGVGRSGAYVAVDRVLQSLQRNPDKIDIYGIVHEMRMARPKMVQTEAQYILIHNAVKYALQTADHNYVNAQDNNAFVGDEGLYENVHKSPMAGIL